MSLLPNRRLRLSAFSILLFIFSTGELVVFGGETPKNCNPNPTDPIPIFKTVRPIRNQTIPTIQPTRVAPLAGTEATYDFTGTLEGSWDHVVGYICFPFQDKINHEDFYACIIGLRTESMGNNQYRSVGWDKKVFWLDVGDRAPMHVFAIGYPYCVVDGVRYDNVYYAPNFVYLPPDGNPDTDTPLDIDLWLSVNQEKKVEKTWINLYDEEGETVSRKELEIGDQLYCFVPAIKLDEPETFYGYTIEDRFQTVKKEPVFFYDHLTPNVDFVNEMTKDYIDFKKVRLYYVLYGQGFTIDGTADYEYSSPLASPTSGNLQWGDSTTATENWLIHEMSSAMKFFLPE